MIVHVAMYDDVRNEIYPVSLSLFIFILNKGSNNRPGRYDIESFQPGRNPLSAENYGCCSRSCAGQFTQENTDNGMLDIKVSLGETNLQCTSNASNRFPEYNRRGT